MPAALLGTAAVSAALPIRPGGPQAKPVIRVGVIDDQSGPYRDVNGPTSIACARQAIHEVAPGAFNVQVLTADHQNKPTLAAVITKQWIDQGHVDLIQDGASSAAASAINAICKERNEVFIPRSPATLDLTGKASTPHTIHWIYDSYTAAHSTGGAMVKAGGDTWLFVTPNYAAGIAFPRDTTRFVEGVGGKVLGGAANQRAPAIADIG